MEIRFAPDASASAFQAGLGNILEKLGLKPSTAVRLNLTAAAPLQVAVSALSKKNDLRNTCIREQRLTIRRIFLSRDRGRRGL
jgi:hypothetical protein